MRFPRFLSIAPLAALLAACGAQPDAVVALDPCSSVPATALDAPVATKSTLNGWVNGKATMNGSASNGTPLPARTIRNGFRTGVTHGLRAMGLAAAATPDPTFEAWFDESPEVAGEFLTYFARCALDPAQALEHRGQRYPGEIGLASGWIDRAPTGSERRWVSACLMALTNARGVHRTVLLRGKHPALGHHEPGDEAFTIREGGYFGDLFVEDGTLSACSGAAVPRVDTGRLCAWPVSTDPSQTACGFTAVGTCDSACNDENECNGIPEVMEVYLEPKDFDASCLARSTG